MIPISDLRKGNLIETDTDTIRFIISPNISSYGGSSTKASFKGKAFTNLVATQILSQRERELYEYEFQLKSL